MMRMDKPERPTVAEALKQASREVRMERFADQWYVYTWDSSIGLWRDSAPTTYAQAQEHACRARAERALELLGRDPLDLDPRVRGRFGDRVRATMR